jgi:hypothetical protein
MEVGRSDSEIARLIGTPRGTIFAWRHGRGFRYHQRIATATPDWRPSRAAAYSYILGMYLGDGCLSVSAGWAASLIVTLDSAYPGIVGEVERALEDVIADTPVRRFLRMKGSVTALQINHPALPFAFPQHGPGKSTSARSSSPTGSSTSRGAILASSSAVSSTRTAAAPSTGSRRSCRAAGSPSTPIRATSSRTCPPTSGGSSATTASCSASVGRSPTRATSRSLTGRASLCSTSSSGRRPRGHSPSSRLIHSARNGSLISASPPSRAISSSRSSAPSAFCTVDGPGSAKRRR